MALKASLDDGKAELKGGIEVPFFQHRRGDPGALVVAEARQSAEQLKGSPASPEEGGSRAGRRSPVCRHRLLRKDIPST